MSSDEVVVQLPEPTGRDLYVDRNTTRTAWSRVSVYSDGTMHLTGYGYLWGPAQARKLAAELLAAAAFAEALPPAAGEAS